DPGAEVFRACVACHTLNANDGVRAGPTLADIFGRRIATLPGYNFSDALKKLDIVWTPEKVSKLFEVGPMTYTPGTKMPEQRIGSAEDRAALVKFLEKATKTPGARAYRRSSRCADQFENGIGNRAGCFLRQIVAGSRDHSMLIRAGKVSGVLEGAFRRREAAAVAVQHDGRYRNTRLGGQPPLNRFQARIAAGVAETVTVGMDHNLDKIRIVERHGGAVLRPLIQPPLPPPQPRHPPHPRPTHPPQQSTKLAAIGLQSGAAPFGVKVVLIPKPVLLLRRRRFNRPSNVLDVVAVGGDHAEYALRPERGDDARGAP